MKYLNSNPTFTSGKTEANIRLNKEKGRFRSSQMTSSRAIAGLLQDGSSNGKRKTLALLTSDLILADLEGHNLGKGHLQRPPSTKLPIASFPYNCHKSAFWALCVGLALELEKCWGLSLEIGFLISHRSIEFSKIQPYLGCNQDGKLMDNRPHLISSMFIMWLFSLKERFSSTLYPGDFFQFFHTDLSFLKVFPINSFQVFLFFPFSCVFFTKTYLTLGLWPLFMLLCLSLRIAEFQWAYLYLKVLFLSLSLSVLSLHEGTSMSVSMISSLFLL